MTKEEALDLALEALEESHPEAYRHVIAAIKQALAAPVQEPVLWLVNGVVQASDIPTNYTGCLYTTPPAAQRQWVGLTDEEVGDLSDFAYANDEEFVRNVEAKLKEKNA